MAKNICPKCKEVILGLGNEVIISCEKCNTVFKTVDDRDDPDIIETICPKCFKIFEVSETLEDVSCPYCVCTYNLPKLIPQISK